MNSNALLLDDIDQSIVQQLRRDGRTPYKTLARQLDLTEATVRARVKRLEESDSLRVVAVSDYEAVGFGVLLAVGVQVEGRPAEDVAADLAELDAVFSVCQVVGARDIETLAVARDLALALGLGLALTLSILHIERPPSNLPPNAQQPPCSCPVQHKLSAAYQIPPSNELIEVNNMVGFRIN